MQQAKQNDFEDITPDTAAMLSSGLPLGDGCDDDEDDMPPLEPIDDDEPYPTTASASANPQPDDDYLVAAPPALHAGAHTQGLGIRVCLAAAHAALHSGAHA